jgi:hypothetical protein
MKKLTPNRTFLYGLATGALLIVAMVSCAKAYPILPPEEYDHPFDGQLSTAVTHDLEQLAVLCGTPAVGCVHLPNTHGLGPKECRILMLHADDLKKYGETSYQLYRHERAHCNGWRHPLDRNSPEWQADELTSRQRLSEESVKERVAVPWRWYRPATPMWPGAQ